MHLLSKLRNGTTSTEHLGCIWSFAFQQRDNGHGMPVSEGEVLLQPGYYRAGLYLRAQLALQHKSFVTGQTLEVSGALAGLCLDVVEICLK